MSSLNSTSENSSLVQVLVDGRKLSWDQIHDAKVDVAHLERKFELVKPQLKYLGMYKSLAERLAHPHYDTVRKHLSDRVELEQDSIHLLGQGQFNSINPSVLQFGSPGAVPWGRVYLFITKQGHWTVLARYYPANEVKLLTCNSVAELCDIVEQLPSNGLEYYSPKRHPAAFQISLALDFLVEGRVSERRKRLESMEGLQGDMKRLNDRMTGGR